MKVRYTDTASKFDLIICLSHALCKACHQLFSPNTDIRTLPKKPNTISDFRLIGLFHLMSETNDSRCRLHYNGMPSDVERAPQNSDINVGKTETAVSSALQRLYDNALSTL